MIYLLLFSAVFFLAYFMFHPSLALSCASGAIDFPSKRKIHTKPVARAGGFAFFAAFSVALIAIPIDIALKIPLILSGTVMFFVGFLDDILSITPFAKLSGQFFSLSIYFFLTEYLNYGISSFEAIISAIWIIYITNATNLIDGLDGLAGGICASQSLSLAAIAMLFGNEDVSICSFLLLGGILGFIPRNFPRAKIFMGDCGALFLGFTLGVLSSRLVIEANSVICPLATLLAFRVPIYDTNFSIARRLIKRENPFKADKGHFHHQLLRLGFSKECTALALITAALLFGFLGVLISALI